jgi:hypothetical protein
LSETSEVYVVRKIQPKGKEQLKQAESQASCVYSVNIFLEKHRSNNMNTEYHNKKDRSYKVVEKRYRAKNTGVMKSNLYVRRNED